MVTQMSRARFEALTMWCRGPDSRAELASRTFFSADNERLLGAVYFIRPADSFAYVLLARDTHGRYQAFSNIGPFRTARSAERAIALRLTALAGEKTPLVPMLKNSQPGVDLFAEIKKAKLNPKFINLRDGRNPSAAREFLREMAKWIKDLDGNLVRDFQTTGFDSRTWELYLFASFTELNFGFDKSDAVPDFRLLRGKSKIFVEAVTSNPTGDAKIDIKGAPSPPPKDFWHYMEHEMPQKFGSPLLSKLRKRYWERKGISGHPFMLAIADFHAPASMTWSHIALPFYLYGTGVEIKTGPDGARQGTPKKLGDHVVGKKRVPTNFFAQRNTQHISAVLFSNAGTMAKFNRMGVLAGFGDPEVSITREGGLNDPTPGAFEAIPFRLNIEDPEYDESWADEIEIYHNPNALVPLPEAHFSGVTQFFMEDDELVWRGPSPRVLFSSTMSSVPKDG